VEIVNGGVNVVTAGGTQSGTEGTVDQQGTSNHGDGTSSEDRQGEAGISGTNQ
jgi:hypothetical protein